MTALNPNGNPVRIGRITLRTPGLVGEAMSLPTQTSGGTRGAALTSKILEDALATSNVEAQALIEISHTREVRAPSGQTRSTSYGEPALVMEVPDAGEGKGQLVLYTDESGVLTWHFPQEIDEKRGATRGGQTRTYVIPRYVAPPGAAGETRGLVGFVGSKVLKVLAFPLIQKGIGAVADYFVAKWERENRPYLVRSFTPDNYRFGPVPALDAEAWRKLSQGRSLLMVHGTMSQSHTGFGGLPHDYVELLNAAYQGRVLAFDQITLSEDPRKNVDWLLNEIPDGSILDLDVICHSRGGLVSRVLVEKQGELSIGSKRFRLSVKNVVFVGAPNAGTVLTDTKHMGDYVDACTNLLNFVPSAGMLDVLQVVITLAKQLAVGAFKGLDGLESMLPQGNFLTTLNKRGTADTNYYAIASNYEPSQPGFKVWAKNRLVDRIFNQDNDLIVPTAGVYDTSMGGSFPIATRQVFTAKDGVAHSEYFASPVAREKIADWLLPEEAARPANSAAVAQPRGGRLPG